MLITCCLSISCISLVLAVLVVQARSNSKLGLPWNHRLPRRRVVQGISAFRRRATLAVGVEEEHLSKSHELNA